MLDLLDHAGPSEPLAGISPLPSDEVSVPPQNRVGCHDRRDLAQRRASKTVSTHREATPLIIRESQPSAAQLGPQDAILFHQMIDHCPDSESAGHSADACAADLLGDVSSGALGRDGWCGFLQNGSVDVARADDVLHALRD